MSDLIASMAAARERFMTLVGEVRPELHRYATRMTGSVFDGEDVVQDTLAKAWYALAAMDAPPPLRPWLFRIAHNTAMDFLRRYEHRNVDADADVEALVDAAALRDADENEPDDARVAAALQLFAILPPVQRSALALKDVLGLTLEETAATMGTTVPAVKGALVRARANVAASRAARTSGATTAAVDTERLRRYAELFNERRWDDLRALFGEETRLDVVSRFERRGGAAAQYFTQYADRAPVEDLRAVAGWVGPVPAIAIFRPASSRRPAYFIQLEWSNDQVAQVRDFRYVPYIAEEATFTPSGGSPHIRVTSDEER